MPHYTEISALSQRFIGKLYYSCSKLHFSMGKLHPYIPATVRYQSRKPKDCPQTGPAVSFMLLEELVGTDKMQETKIAMGF